MSNASAPPPRPAPDVPPPLRAEDLLDDVPPKKKGLSKGMIILIVCAVLAIPCIAGLIATVAIIVPQMQEKQKRLTCMENLSQLSQTFAATQSGVGAPKRSGTAMFLEWRKSRRLIREGEELILVCPGDPSVAFPDSPEARRRYDTVDLDAPPADLCSYAARDFARFPLDSKSGRREPIAACLHHRHGAIVAFSDGSARFMDLDELAVDAGTELTVGPDSPAEMLQSLTFGNGRTR
ncbi:MAG: hypothetical protein K8T90_20370 [Planctomycetes bacterium]|nr:hypothetical protein [Planctomycetota bacterium]